VQVQPAAPRVVANKKRCLSGIVSGDRLHEIPVKWEAGAWLFSGWNCVV